MSFGQYGFSQVQISFGGLTWAGAMAPGVQTITAIDDNFNGAEFLSYAEGAFWRVMKARASGDLSTVRPLLGDAQYHHLTAMGTTKAPVIASVQHATIYDARHDAAWDTVTVRFAAVTTAKRKNDFVEDWTFQRPAALGQAPLPQECPSCGAPLALDDNGGCRYCRVVVGGARGGWKLVRTGPPTNAGDPGPVARRGVGAGVAAWVVFMVLMTVVLPLGIWYAVDQSTGDLFDSVGGSGGGAVMSSSSGEPMVAATAAFTGAITASVDGTVVTVGATSGPCTARAADLRGFTLVYAAEDASSSQAITVTMQYPDATKGATTFDLATTPFTVSVAYAAKPDPSTGAAPSAQTWSPGVGTTGTFTLSSDAAGHLVVDGLVPSAPAGPDDPLGQPLSMVVDLTCS